MASKIITITLPDANGINHEYTYYKYERTLSPLTDEEIAAMKVPPNILGSTENMSNADWLAARKHGIDGSIDYTIGGSDTATVLGISPWTAPLTLYKVKHEEIPNPVKSNPEQLEMGHLLEPVVAEWFTRQTGYKVYNDFNLYQSGIYEYALANVDRLFEMPDGRKGILECKSTAPETFYNWQDGTIPPYYECQVRFYMAVLDIDFAAISCIAGNNPTRHFATIFIERDYDYEKELFECLDEFVACLRSGTPPSLDNIQPKLALESLVLCYKGDKSAPTITLTDVFADKVKAINDWQDKIKEYKSIIKDLEENISAASVPIVEIMKGHEKGIIAIDGVEYTIDYTTKVTNRFDTTRFKAENPDVYKEYTKPSESRSLKIVPPKKKGK